MFLLKHPYVTLIFRILAFSLDEVKSVQVNFNGGNWIKANNEGGPLFTVPWTPKKYASGLHHIKVSLASFSQCIIFKIPRVLSHFKFNVSFRSKLLILQEGTAQLRNLFLLMELELVSIFYQD